MKTAIISILFLLATALTSFSQNVGVNADGTPPDNSAMLDVKSTSKGFLPPRMTVAQRDAISNPVTGLIVFCTDFGASGSLFLYSGSSWSPIGASAIAAPVAGTHVPGKTQITWNWNVVAGATGYKWNTANNYATATDAGTSTTTTQTGLTEHTYYTIYIWAYSNSGASTPTTLRQTTLYLGMPYQGGKIFYIYPDGLHGLIAANQDQLGFNIWSMSSRNITTSTAIGTGQANTNTILNDIGTWGKIYPAGFCDNYAVTEGGVIYDDWYLPSKDELVELYNNRYLIGGFIEGYYASYTVKWYYWSSSQASSTSAWFVAWDIGSAGNGDKSSYKLYTRAVRSF